MPPTRRAGAGLLVIGLGTLAAPLDTSVNIAFPSITSAFALAVEDIRWVVIAYVLTYASLMLIFGKLGDLVGYTRIFQLGLLVSALGFAACSVAPTYGLLLLGRMLQGVGIALTLSCGPALATSLFDESVRARVLSAYAGVTAVGSALGPLVGGALVERWGWSAVFWFRLPLVLTALALSLVLPAAYKTGAPRSFDAPGAAMLVVWMSALLLAFAVPAQQIGPALPIGLALLAVLAFAGFVVREVRHPEPIVRPQLFRDADFAAINLASIAVNLAAFSVLLIVPYYLVRIAGLDAAAGGGVLALGAAGAIVGAWAAGRMLAAKARAGPVALLGILLSIGGLFAISTWTADTGVAGMSLSLLGQGLGVGLFQVAYAERVVATLPIEDRGVAGSLTMVTRTIGVVGGATGLSAAFRHFETAAVAAGVHSPFLAGFQATFMWVAAGLALCLALSLLRPRIWLAGG